MIHKIEILFSLCLGLSVSATTLATPTPAGQQEIEYLISHLAKSGCEFYRNGTWYDSGKAEEHLRTKFEYARSGIAVAEDFIAKAASNSSFSGEAYQVRCGVDARAVTSSQWLTEALARYRAVPR